MEGTVDDPEVMCERALCGWPATAECPGELWDPRERRYAATTPMAVCDFHAAHPGRTRPPYERKGKWAV